MSVGLFQIIIGSTLAAKLYAAFKVVTPFPLLPLLNETEGAE